MNELKVKNHIVNMLKEGFNLAPCANPQCEQLFSSGIFCSQCELENNNPLCGDHIVPIGECGCKL